MEYIIGLDIGTTSTKAIAFDLGGNILNKHSIEYPILPNTEPTYSEQDVNEILSAVVNSIKYVVDENKDKDHNLLGVSFSSAMHSLIALDEKGNAMTNCIIWADTRSKKYAEEMKNCEFGHEVYMRTGTPIHPMSPLCKLAWMKDNLKDIFNKTYKFVSIKEYVFFRLFDQYIIDYSLASSTGLFDIYDLKWNEKALQMAGISEEKLSTPVSGTFKCSGMKKEFAAQIGIDINTPFIVGASDGCLANLGTNAIVPGSAAVTIGTSGAIRIISDQPKNDEKERIFSYILTENHYVLGGPVNNGGIIFRWFKDNFSAEEIERAKEVHIDPYELLTEAASKVPAGAEGLIFLPYLLGERAPHWDANARGVYFGIHIRHTRAHFLRALLEGVIYGVYSVGKALEETTGKFDIIYATGGFVRSELWVQMLADVFNKKVAIAESFESSCLGAAVLGMKALEIIESVEEVEKLVPISKVFEPDIQKHGVYIRNFEIYDRLYEKLKGEFIHIGNIQ